MRTRIAVMALIDYKCRSQRFRIDLVSTEQIDDFDVTGTGAGDNPSNIATAGSRYEAEVKTSDAGRRVVQDVETTPTLANHAGRFGKFARRRQNRCTIATYQGSLPEDQHRMFCVPQYFGEQMTALGQLAQRFGAGPKVLVAVGQVHIWTDRCHSESAFEIALTQPGIDESRFGARVSADQDTGIGLFDTGNRGIEQIASAHPGLESRPILAAIDVR